MLDGKTEDQQDISSPSRSLTMLNESGDLTLEWSAEQDDHMLALIEKKMKEGVAFYIVPQRKPGQRGAVAKPKKLAKTEDALKHRSLSIPDADLSKFVLEGRGTVTNALAPPEMSKGVKRAIAAQEVAKGHSVGIKQRVGG